MPHAPQFLPGLFATIAILMINLTSQGELYSYSSMDDSADCRAKFWLLLSYLVRRRVPPWLSRPSIQT